MLAVRLHLLLILLLLAGPTSAFTVFDSKYDRAFEKYSEMYMPGRPWKLFKAQCYQESRFQTLARSPVGAAGLCQFMPATWNEQQTLLRKMGSVYDPELNIQFGAYYMMRLRRMWTAKRPVFDKESLAMASYNAGTGNILKAQKKCGNKSGWSEISPCLVMVTGKQFSHETRTYVERIWKYYIQLGGAI